jgi:hypothetical protein
LYAGVLEPGDQRRYPIAVPPRDNQRTRAEFSGNPRQLIYRAAAE